MSQRIPFSPGKYVAMRPITFNGKKYKAGANFDPEKANCDSRRLRQLYDNRMIDMKVSRGS